MMNLVPCVYKDNIWSGPPKTEVYHKDLSVGQIFHMQLRNWPENIVQINDIDNKVLKGKEALILSIRIAQHFKKMRLTHDDVIGIAAKNSTYLVAMANACLFNTTPFHAVNPIHEETTINHLFDLTKPKVIFCDGNVYQKIFAATKHFKPIIYTLTDHIDGVPKVEDLLEPTKTEMFYRPEPLTKGGNQTMAILCSSGTTGMPKAVCLSNEYFINTFDIVCNEDVIFTVSSLDWLTGLLAYIASMIQGCTRLITNKPFEAEYVLGLIQKYKITWTFMPPRHLNAFIDYPKVSSEKLKTVRILSCGGGSISLPTLEKAQSLFKNAFIHYGYAFTEFGTATFNMGLEQGTSSGKLCPGVQAQIVDENGKPLGPNEAGEVYLKRPFPWAGYFSNPIETQKMQDGHGWFRSGDIGYFDKEHFLYIVDRKKEVLKYQGMQYWSTEIEKVIQKMPGVADVCVFGIYDEKNGDAPGALVVKGKGSQITENDVKMYVAKELPESYKHLHAGVIFTDELPHNANGKTVKKTAKEMFIKLSNGK